MPVKQVRAQINGTWHTLTLNNGKYSASIAAPAITSYTQPTHYYPVTIEVTDMAGNVTTKTHTDALLGSKLRLTVGVSSKIYQDAEFPSGKGYVIQIGEILVQAVHQNSLSSGTFYLPKSFADTNYAVVICSDGRWGVDIGAYVSTKTKNSVSLAAANTGPLQFGRGYILAIGRA